MSSGLKIRIPVRHPTAVNSGTSSSALPLSSVEDSKLESKMNDVETKENEECLPEQKYTTRSGHIRNPAKKWVQWEIDFLEKCFETTQYPKRQLRSEWALILTEKRLQNITRSPKDKENLAQIWFEHYERRLYTWVKHRRIRQRREGGALVEENPEGLVDDEACPIAPPGSHFENHSVTIVQGFTVLKDSCDGDGEEQYENEHRELEEEIDELEGDTIDSGWILPDEVLRKGRQYILAHLHNLLTAPLAKPDPPT